MQLVVRTARMRHLVEALRQQVQGVTHRGAAHRQPMSAQQGLWIERRQPLDRAPRGWPILSEIHRRPVQFGACQGDGVGGFLRGGDDGVRRQQRAVGLPPQRHMAD